MIKIYQRITDKGKGDCVRAVIASMFELDIEQVPHFLLFDYEHPLRYETNSFHVMYHFILGLGYKSIDYHNIKNRSERTRIYPTRKNLVNRCIYAQVPSMTYERVSHAVLINSKGRVIHDPNPNKKWLGKNAIKTGNLLGWYIIKK